MFSEFGQSDYHARYRPLLTIGSYPLYLVQVLVVIQVVAMILTSFLNTAGWQLLAFSSLDVQRGYLWQLVTYPLFDMPSIWWAIAMLITFFIGPEVEKYIGRMQMLLLYLAMILAGSITLSLLSLVGIPSELAGSLKVMFGIFIGFATLYPNVQFNAFFFTITLKVAAWILLGINIMMAIAYGSWPGAVAMIAISACSYGYLKFIGVRGGFTWWEDWWENRRLRHEAKKRNIRVMRERRATQSMDQILDKISRDGISSLSQEEREVLEKARTNLIKRDEKK